MTAAPWRTVTLGSPSVAAISSGGTPSRSRSKYFGGTVRWVKSGDLNDSTVVDTDECITEEALQSSAAKLLPIGTVLVAMYGATVGKTAILGLPAATNQAVCSIRPNRDVFNPRFLQYLLMHWRPTLLAERYGGAQPNISQTIVSALRLPCPDVSEQENVAALLWKLQRAVATQDRLIAATRDLKQAAMQRLFTHGLRGETLKDSAIGPMPESWRSRTILELCEIWSGGTPRKSIAEHWKGEIPWVSGKDLKTPSLDDAIDHITPEGVEAGSRLSPKGSVLLLVRGMGLAKDLPVAVINRPMAFNQDIKALVSRGEYSGDFLRSAIYVGKARLMSQIVPSAHGTMTLNLDDVESFEIACTSDPNEADEIVATIATIDRKLAHHQRKRTALNDLFQTALHKLMTAQIRVADLDIDTSEIMMPPR